MQNRWASGFLRSTVTVLVILLLRGGSQAASFTSGNIVVYRVGDGTAALASTGSAVFLDEYTPGGMLVQSVGLPTTVSGSNNQLIASGTASSEGLLTRSSDGHYLLLTGYARNLGGSGSLSSTTSAAVPRTVGRVKFDGTIDTSTALTDFATGNNPRSAASTDGVNIWVGGGAGGVRYTHYSAFGSTTSTQLSTDSTNIRQVAIFDGQLYTSTQTGSAFRVGTVGVGTPTNTGQSITSLPGFPTTGNLDAFFFADLDSNLGVDTLYVADDTAGQIQKYALISGSWIARGTIAAASVRGLIGVVSGTTVTLYATSNGSAGTSGTLYSFTDVTGYNATVSGTAATLATAGTNEAFRGVTLAPVSSMVPTQTPTATATPTQGPSTSTPTATGNAATHTAVAGTPTPTAGVTPPSPTRTVNTPTMTAMATAAATPTSSPAVTAFTPGNVVVYRVGDGTATLTDNGTAVFLDEYTPSGGLVQSVALPTTASGLQNQLIATSDVSEGLLARSTDGQYVLLTGYASNLGGSTALATTAATAVPRTVGRVKFDGTIDTTTALTDMSSANNVRSATSTTGTDIWVGGASSTSGGVHYTTLGATTSTQLFTTIPKGVRQVNIFGDQLYFDSNATGLLNVSAVGVGVPTTGGQTGTELPGLADTAGNDGYFFADLGDGHGLATLYVANDSLGEILKYALVSGSWTASGTITAAGVHGVTGVVSGGSVTLYATGTTGSDGTLYSFTDTTGYDGMVSGAAATVATAPANKSFRGVALAPVGLNPPTPTRTGTNTPSATASVPNTPTYTATMTSSPTRTPSATNTLTRVPSSTPTPTPTVSNTQTQTPTATKTPTQTPSVTNTSTLLPTATKTSSATNTPVPTNTPTPTDTPTATKTPSPPPTATRTSTPEVINTSTQVPTATGTLTAVPTSSPTFTATASETATLIPSPTETATETPMDTPTDTPTPSPTGTQTLTSTPSDTATETPTASATPTVAEPACVGDCNGNGVVTVDEILKMVNIALESAPVLECTAGDADHNGQITVNEIIAAVDDALTQCPTLSE
jgi:hypothetical protein